MILDEFLDGLIWTELYSRQTRNFSTNDNFHVLILNIRPPRFQRAKMWSQWPENVWLQSLKSVIVAGWNHFKFECFSGFRWENWNSLKWFVKKTTSLPSWTFIKNTHARERTHVQSRARSITHTHTHKRSYARTRESARAHTHTRARERWCVGSYRGNESTHLAVYL